MNPSELRSHVDTIVVVLENRSFDHVLGWMRHPDYGARADVDGVDDLGRADLLNPNGDGVGVAPFWMPDGPLASDLPHDKASVRTQLAYASVAGSYLMNGFVRAYEDASQSSIDRPPVMGLLTPRDLPATRALALQYTVCDRWFACAPTSTAPNRLLSMCGATSIDETGGLLPEQPTVYDWLLAHHVRWRVYSAGLPFFALMPRLAPLLLTSHFRRLSELPGDLARDPPDLRPQVIFVEPDYYDCPVHFAPPCDNHAPLAMAPGEAFLGQVVRWLAADPARWARTALVVTYDEHGGFFDHVAPAPIGYRGANGVAFDTTGPRVPALVAGPFAPRGVSHAVLDNTAILQLLADRFADGAPYSPAVQDRARQGIGSLASILSTTAANGAAPDIGGAAVSSAPTRSASIAAPPATGPLRAGFDAAMRRLVAEHQAEAIAKYPELGGLR